MGGGAALPPEASTGKKGGLFPCPCLEAPPVRPPPLRSSPPGFRYPPSEKTRESVSLRYNNMV
jgi:hypothetical protein